VTLTSPAQKPTAHQQIQIGYIQTASEAGSAGYATTPLGKPRAVTTPTSTTVDWLVTPCSPGATDLWPWYDSTSMVTGTGSGSFSDTITMGDAPSFAFPAQYNPNSATDPNKSAALQAGQDVFSFTVHVAVRTKDADLLADQAYFSAGQTTWTVTFIWPVTPAVSLVTTGAAAWTVPPSPDSLSVNVVPTATNHNIPFRQMIPS
jgi:hypothetical protein